MKTILKYSVAIATCLMLTSCWLPEAFDATLHVDKAKNFKFTYKGTMAYIPALGQIKEKGRLPSETEAAMKEAEKELRKQEGFKKLEYTGDGRFKVEFEQTGLVVNDKKVFLELVEFKVSSTGRITIQGAEIPADASKALTELKCKMNGTLSVTTDLTVVKENAASRPSLGGRIGAYMWKINPDQAARPEIVLQP